MIATDHNNKYGHHKPLDAFLTQDSFQPRTSEHQHWFLPRRQRLQLQARWDVPHGGKVRCQPWWWPYWQVAEKSAKDSIIIHDAIQYTHHPPNDPSIHHSSFIHPSIHHPSIHTTSQIPPRIPLQYTNIAGWKIFPEMKMSIFSHWFNVIFQLQLCWFTTGYTCFFFHIFFRNPGRHLKGSFGLNILGGASARRLAPTRRAWAWRLANWQWWWWWMDDDGDDVFSEKILQKVCTIPSDCITVSETVIVWSLTLVLRIRCLPPGASRASEFSNAKY